MIRVLIEVGAARPNVVVLAESIQRALSLVQDRYPGSDIRVLFPMNPEAFFVRDPAAAARTTKLEVPEGAAK
jgi:hypothetical protein